MKTKTQAVPVQESLVPEMTRLCDAWLAAKEIEQAAIEHRRQIDEHIAQVLAHPTEGTTTAAVGLYTIKVTGKLTRELDPEKVATLDAQIPPEILRRLIEYKPSLNLREYRYLEANEPQHFQALASAVTTKPAKPTIDITVKEP